MAYILPPAIPKEEIQKELNERMRRIHEKYETEQQLLAANTLKSKQQDKQNGEIIDV